VSVTVTLARSVEETTMKTYLRVQGTRIWFALLALASTALVLGAGQRWH
jgi:hypothetical protein